MTQKEIVIFDSNLVEIKYLYRGPIFSTVHMVLIAEEWNFLFLGWPASGAPAYFVGRNSKRTDDQLPVGIAAWGTAADYTQAQMVSRFPEAKH